MVLILGWQRGRTTPNIVWRPRSRWLVGWLPWRNAAWLEVLNPEVGVDRLGDLRVRIAEDARLLVSDVEVGEISDR